jgi:phage major tail protein, phi13 family
MSDINKITYGLSNVHVWPITSTDASGVPTYGTVITVPGAKEMKLSAEGDTAKFYADNILYWTAEANNGYSGTLTIAEMPDDFAEKVLNQVKDSKGVFLEDAMVTGTEFAMAFEFEGDVNKKRVLFYRCTAGRPDVGSSTKEDKIEPNTQEIAITAVPRLDNHYVKASVADASSAAYSAWYSAAPYEPTITAATTSAKTSTSS